MNQIWTIAQTHPVPPCTIVIFGASGDLAARKLLPALYNLEHCGKDAIPPKIAILGFARREMSVEAFRAKAREAITRFSRLKMDDESWRRFAERRSPGGAAPPRRLPPPQEPRGGNREGARPAVQPHLLSCDSARSDY